MSFLFVKRVSDWIVQRTWCAFTLVLFWVFFLSIATLHGADYWALQGGPEGGNISFIAVDPTNVDFAYASNSNGLYKTLDGGNSWVNINPYWGRNAKVVIDPINPK